MKNTIIKIIIYILAVSQMFAQEFVSTEPQLRNVVLELFTGIHCGNCPGGHKIASELAEAYPGRVSLISIHEGYYANPSQGEPDFRTKWGKAILDNTGVTGFPAGTINRLRFPDPDNTYPYYKQVEGGMALSVSGLVAAATDSVLNGTFSPVNIAAKMNWNNDTRELTIDVEIYFTEDVPDGIKLNISFLESHIWGPQTGASDPKNYEHNHVLRDMITGQWGEDITAAVKGSVFRKTYIYTVSENIKIINSSIAIFATQSNNEQILTGIDIQIIPPNILVTNKENRIVNAVSYNLKQLSYDLQNISNHQINFELSIEKSERTPEVWTSGFNGGFTEFDLLPGEIVTHSLNVDLHNQKGIGDFILKFNEKGNPVSNPLYDTVTVLTTDINYLEIQAGGSNINFLLNARSEFTSMPIETYREISERLDKINIVVWNSGKMGRFSKVDATSINGFIKDGKGLLINGSGGLPTLTFEDSGHELFSTLGINWNESNQIADQQFDLTGYENDPVSGNFNASDLSVTNNGYLMQSLNITNPEKAYPMIKMVGNNKVISTRIINDVSKSVYLGFNIDIIEDDNIKNDLMKRIIDWIEGTIDVKDISTKQGESELSVFNKAENGEFIININYHDYTETSAELFIVDLTGMRVKEIFSGRLDNLGMSFPVNVNELVNGYYFVILKTNKVIKTVPLVLCE